MKICPKCNNELEEGVKFCNFCGARIFEIISCPNCGNQSSSEFSFCSKCGAFISKDVEGSVYPMGNHEKKKNIFQALSPKMVMFSGIGLLTITVIILIAFKLLGDNGKDNYGLYLKDGEIVYSDYSEKGTFEITSRLLNDEDTDNSNLFYGGSSLGSYIAFSDDGNRIFFPDKLSDDDGITLYFRNIHKPDEEPVKIDSDVSMYAINNDGTQVVYVKGDDKNLYVHNLIDKKKISSGVDVFYVANDCKKIGYLTEEDNYYLWYAGKDSIKMASGVSEIEYVTSDLSTIYFTKEDSLYKQIEGAEEKEKIASDISSIVAIYDSGEVYYSREESVELSLWDYVDDDMAVSDAAMLFPEFPGYPDEPDYPSWGDYGTNEEYNVAWLQYEAEYKAYQTECDRIEKEYDRAYEAYSEKCDRDFLREELQSDTMTLTKYALYYFNGSEENIVTDALVNDEWGITYANKKPVMIIQVYNQSEVQKVKISEISNPSEVEDLVDDAFDSSRERHVVIGSTSSIIEQNDAADFMVSSDGKNVYFLDDVSGDGYGDLYKVTITDSQVSSPEIYDRDVCQGGIFFTTSEKLAYYKNVTYEDDKGDLFINGEEIDYDVQLMNIFDLDDCVLYYTDWNSEKEYGTLKMFRNGTKIKIADDVHDFVHTNDDNILYLYDTSINSYTGTLYLYNNGKPKKIDDDVIALLSANDNIIKGEEWED